MLIAETDGQVVLQAIVAYGNWAIMDKPNPNPFISTL